MIQITVNGKHKCFPSQKLADAFLAAQESNGKSNGKRKPKQALSGKRNSLFLEDPEDLVLIGLDTDDDDSHPLFDERVHWPVDEGLVLNIMVYNVVEPILVRKSKDDNGVERAEVVAGRQRVKAAREASRRLQAEGKEVLKIRTIAERGEDHNMFGINISTNELRQDDTPLGRARKVRTYLSMGRTVEEAAIMFDRSTYTIQDWLKLLEMEPEVLQAIEAGALSAHAALKMSSLSRKEQRKALKALLEGKKVRNRKPALPVPTKATLRKVIEAAPAPEGFVAKLSPEFAAGIRYALGTLTAAEVEGLEEILV